MEDDIFNLFPQEPFEIQGGELDFWLQAPVIAPAIDLSLQPTEPVKPKRYIPPPTRSKIIDEQDKRKRNTEASARFRLKKKEREKELTVELDEMKLKVKELELKLSEKEKEVAWMRSLIHDKLG